MKSLPVEPIDLAPFQSILDEADRCFRLDVSYAVAVSKAARTIASKRVLWKLRLELREASDVAQAKCGREKPFNCATLDPCGVGTCKFAQGDLASLTVPDCAGDTERPQTSSKGDFSLEAAAEPLRQLREQS
jgi:hypothetical protein